MKIDELGVTDTCGDLWDAMRPVSPHARRCERCARDVHDLSSMTEAAARRWLRDPANHDRCLTFLHDAAGQVVFVGAALPPAPPAQLRGLNTLVAAAAIALPLTLGGAALADAPVAPDAEAGALEEPTTDDPQAGPATPPCGCPDAGPDHVHPAADDVTVDEVPVTPPVRIRTAGVPMRRLPPSNGDNLHLLDDL